MGMDGRPERAAPFGRLLLSQAVVLFALLISSCTNSSPQDGAQASNDESQQQDSQTSNNAGPTTTIDKFRDEPTQTTTNNRATFNPDPKPESPSFLYSSDLTGVFHIFLRQDGTDIQLTEGGDYDNWRPRLAPDGSRILFSRTLVADRPAVGSVTDNYQNASVWTIRADGSGLSEVISDAEFQELGPVSWSPDGQEVVFAATDERDGRVHLWVADTFSYVPRRISNRSTLYLDPSYSADGSRIAFISFPDGYVGNDASRLEVFVMDSDGTNEQRLTIDEFEDGAPTWSPDGRSLAVTTATDDNYLFVGKWALRMIELEDGSITTVLDDDNVNISPRWTADGTALFFQRYVFGESGIYLAIVDIESSTVAPLTDRSSEFDNIDIDPVGSLLR